jgi:hypothetical protein
MERLLTEGYYYLNGPERDYDKALAAYRAASLIDSTSTSALNNAAVIEGDRKNNWAAAESLYRKVVKAAPHLRWRIQQPAHGPGPERQEP